jgi:cytoskeletal protein RodZ
MESVGQKLRAARLNLGLSLEDISARTRINLKNLSALEADAFEVISSRFIYKSFALQVAQAVGLNPDSLRDALDAAVSQIPEPLVPGHPGAPIPPHLPSLRASRVRLSRWVYSLALLIAMLAACSGLYAMWQNSRGSLMASVAKLEVSLEGKRSRPVASPVTPAPGVAHSPITAPVAASPVPQPPPPAVRIEVSALETSWLSVVADGKQVYAGILQPSESKSLEGREMARIRTGNAGGVEVTFNGKKLGPLGSRGQVRTVEFQKDGYRILEPTAHLALANFDPSAHQGFGQ